MESTLSLCESVLFNAMTFAVYLFIKHLHSTYYVSEAVQKAFKEINSFNAFNPNNNLMWYCIVPSLEKGN